MWKDMLSRSEEEPCSQLGQILLLCAQNKENQLLLKILEDLQSKDPEKVSELAFERTGEGRTILDTCKDQKTLIQILKLLDIKSVEDKFLDCDKKDQNVIFHWAKHDFHEAIYHLQTRVSAETFRELIMARSSSRTNALMISAGHGNAKTLDSLLRHVWLYLPTLHTYPDMYKVTSQNHQSNQFLGGSIPLSVRHKHNSCLLFAPVGSSGHQRTQWI